MREGLVATPMTGRRVDFPLCADPEGHEALRPLVEQSVDFIVSEVGPATLEALVLTGSLARGEGSVLRDGDGVRLLGDVEFLAVLPPGDDARLFMLELGWRATERFGDGGRLARVEYGPVTPDFFRRKIRPSIFAFDLVRHGRTLWGGGELLRAIAPFGAEAIPPADAVELVMNRIVEWFLLDDPAARADVEVRAYHGVKMVLDLAGAALAFAGRYVSEYRDRPAAFRRLLLGDEHLRAALGDHAGFMDALERAALCKLHPTHERLVEDGTTAHAASLSRWTLGVWTWQMRRHLGRPGAELNELVEGYLRSEPARARLRAWAKFVLHPLRPASTLDVGKLARWLPVASPRALTYAAALLAFAGKHGRPGDWRPRAAALLPVRRRRAAALAVSEIADVWRWYIRND